MKATKKLGLVYITGSIIFYSVILLISCCSTRKTNLEISKTKTSQESELKIDLKEAVLDKGIIEKLTSDNSYTIVIKEYFGQLPDNSNLSVNNPIFRETTISKTDKKTSEKENKDLKQNKAIQGTEKKKDASISKIKKKPTVRSGVGTGKVIGVSILLIVFGLALWFIRKQMKRAIPVRL